VFDWRDLVVVVVTVIVTLLSARRVPASADQIYLVRVAVGLHIAVQMAIAASFSDYFDRLSYNVAWVSRSFSWDLPVIAYLFLVAVGLLGIGQAALVAVVTTVVNAVVLRVISLLYSIGQIVLLAHTLSLDIIEPVVRAPAPL